MGWEAESTKMIEKHANRRTKHGTAEAMSGWRESGDGFMLFGFIFCLVLHLLPRRERIDKHA